MNILVIGREGQLSRSLAERLRPGHGLSFVGRPEVDLEIPGSVGNSIRAARPELVINAAAYTAVDQAEAEPERAFRVNAEAVGELAEAARAVGAPLIHISTDYVFNGAAGRPYVEDDPTGPINLYGASKLAGEEAVRAAQPDHLILRTSWVYSPFGRNFVSTMLGLASERSEVRVVADQRGCPTSALDLSDALLRLAERRDWGGTLHLAGAESCSWAEFAEAIFTVSQSLGGPSARVRPIPSSDWPTPAARPASSLLDCGGFARRFGFGLPGFQEALPPILARLLEG